jgi:nucleotide-binding universal stress UspA family protein
MYHRLVVPLDGSSPAEGALGHAMALAKPFDAQILLLRVIEDGNLESRHEIERYLGSLSERLGREGFSVGTAIRMGSASRAIREFAQEVDASMIVMSSHGRKSVHSTRLSDTTAMELLNESHVPILIVRPSEYRVRVGRRVGRGAA